MIQEELFERSEVHQECYDTNSRGTPQCIIDCINEHWPIQLDACASAWNAKCENYYSLERGEDSLALPWRGGTWCNPPYSDIQPWWEKALSEEVEALLLLPVRSDMLWFRQAYEMAIDTTRLSTAGLFVDVPVFLFFFPYRINFVYPPGHSAGSSNPERSVLIAVNVNSWVFRDITSDLSNCKLRRRG